MNISVEVLLSIGLALTIPLLGIVAACLMQMRADMKAMTKTLESFTALFGKIDSSLDHNRNEHTQMMAIGNAVLKEIADSKEDVIGRIELLEERTKN